MLARIIKYRVHRLIVGALVAVMVGQSGTTVLAAPVPNPTSSSTIRQAEPTYFSPPKGWTPMNLSPDMHLDFGWLSPHYWGTGENIAVFVREVPSGLTLYSAVRKAAADTLEQGRSIAGSGAHATCHGEQPGWTLDVRIPISPQRAISQIQHFAVRENMMYTILYTHTAGDPINKIVLRSIDSLCPMATK